jgi:hypothetical protein
MCTKNNGFSALLFPLALALCFFRSISVTVQFRGEEAYEGFPNNL